MKRLTVTIIALTLSTGMLVGLAYAHDNSQSIRGPARLVQNLDLTETQQQNFDLMMEGLKSKRKENQHKRKSMRTEMLALLDSSKLDQEKAGKLVADKSRTMEKNAGDMIATIAMFTDSLTTAQKEQLKENIQHRMERMHQRMERNGPAGNYRH
jgi:Spy/CpxP family protein refolding chaperone